MGGEVLLALIAAYFFCKNTTQDALWAMKGEDPPSYRREKDRAERREKHRAERRERRDARGEKAGRTTDEPSAARNYWAHAWRDAWHSADERRGRRREKRGERRQARWAEEDLDAAWDEAAEINSRIPRERARREDPPRPPSSGPRRPAHAERGAPPLPPWPEPETRTRCPRCGATPEDPASIRRSDLGDGLVVWVCSECDPDTTPPTPPLPEPHPDWVRIDPADSELPGGPMSRAGLDAYDADRAAPANQTQADQKEATKAATNLTCAGCGGEIPRGAQYVAFDRHLEREGRRRRVTVDEAELLSAYHLLCAPPVTTEEPTGPPGTDDAQAGAVILDPQPAAWQQPAVGGNPTESTQESSMTTPSGEIAGLQSSIAYTQEMAGTTQSAVTSVETSIAGLQQGGVSGPAIEHLTQAMEALGSASIAFGAANAELQNHLQVTEAYNANDGAGTRDFVRQG
jgi:hypothetical protein